MAGRVTSKCEAISVEESSSRRMRPRISRRRGSAIDYLTGYLMAFGAMVALARRTREGGSWLVRISLAQVGRWLVERGQVPEAELKDVPGEFTPAELERWSMTSDTPVGRLQHLGPVLRLSETPPRWSRPTVPLGYHQPVWPA